MTLILRPYQEKARSDYHNYFKHFNYDNAILDFNQNIDESLSIIPTAGGKSAIQAQVIIDLFNAYPSWNHKILNVTHVKELITQNCDEFMGLAPGIECGIYSAGAKKKEHTPPVIFGGIQSMVNAAHLFGYVDRVHVDEAHRISPDDATLYQKFIKELRRYNPNLKICGFTATAYRLEKGRNVSLIDPCNENRIFKTIHHETSLRELAGDNPEGQRYICPISSKKVKTEINTEDVRKNSKGEFVDSEADKRFDDVELTEKVLDEVLEYAKTRKKVIIFCQTVGHCFRVQTALDNRGIQAPVVTGNKKDFESQIEKVSKFIPKIKDSSNFREEVENDFKYGDLKWVINVGVWTTGFNCKGLDMIVMLRMTNSLNLWVQIVGRGFRLLGKTYEESVANGKSNTLLLDYGGNVERFGPIDLINIEEKKPPKPKWCPLCLEQLKASDRECFNCGYIFPLKDAPTKDCPECSADIPASARKCDAVAYICHPCYDQYSHLYDDYEQARDAGYPYWVYKSPRKYLESEVCCAICNGELQESQYVCGYEFPEREVVHNETASDADIMAFGADNFGIRDVDIDRVEYRLYQKDKYKKPMFNVIYRHGINGKDYREMLFPENSDYTYKLFCDWWRNHLDSESPYAGEMPKTVAEAVSIADLALKIPSKIKIMPDPSTNNQYMKVLSIVEWKESQHRKPVSV